MENYIDFGVYALDDSGRESGWDYDNTKASFKYQLTIIMEGVFSLRQVAELTRDNILDCGLGTNRN